MTANPGGEPGLPFLYLALPVMDEPDLLLRLLNCLSIQTYNRFTLFVCVNQPEAWWNDPGKTHVCEHNSETLQQLKEFSDFKIKVIDRCSKGQGWTGKKHGVGYARKTLMDSINEVAHAGDIIVSMDADTVFGENYLQSVALNFRNHPESTALCVPYFHQTPPDLHAGRAILRYEIYMRHYFLNLYRIGSPYAFTALGSAMAVPVWAYRAIGGMTPKLSGEDFYFLQKLKKYGHVLLWNEEPVYPEARFSDRVFFGTGPAMIRGAQGDWLSYPVYPCRFFDEIAETYSLLPEIYNHPVDTTIVRFLAEAFREDDPVQPLRINNKDPDHFCRAFHEKFDGLRILQYLKAANELNPSSDEENLQEYFTRFYPGEEPGIPAVDLTSFSFLNAPLEQLEKIRMFLYQKEMTVRRFTLKLL